MDETRNRRIACFAPVICALCPHVARKFRHASPSSGIPKHLYTTSSSLRFGGQIGLDNCALSTTSKQMDLCCLLGQLYDGQSFGFRQTPQASSVAGLRALWDSGQRMLQVGGSLSDKPSDEEIAQFMNQTAANVHLADAAGWPRNSTMVYVLDEASVAATLGSLDKVSTMVSGNHERSKSPDVARVPQLPHDCTIVPCMLLIAVVCCQRSGIPWCQSGDLRQRPMVFAAWRDSRAAHATVQTRRYICPTLPSLCQYKCKCTGRRARNGPTRRLLHLRCTRRRGGTELVHRVPCYTQPAARGCRSMAVRVGILSLLPHQRLDSIPEGSAWSRPGGRYQTPFNRLHHDVAQILRIVLGTYWYGSRSWATRPRCEPHNERRWLCECQLQLRRRGAARATRPTRRVEHTAPREHQRWV